MLKITNIADLVFDQDRDTFYKCMEQMLKQDEEYLRAEEVFDRHIKTLIDNNASDYLDVEDSATMMTAAALRIAFKEGFNTAIRTILSAVEQ